MRRSGNRTLKQKRSSPVWLVFLLPTLLGVLLFMAYPIIEVFRLSFYQSNGTIETFKGISNYQYILGNDTFRKAIQKQKWRKLS